MLNHLYTVTDGKNRWKNLNKRVKKHNKCECFQTALGVPEWFDDMGGFEAMW